MQAPRFRRENRLNRTVKTVNGEVKIDGHRFNITFARADGNRKANYCYDFRRHPLRHLLAAYIPKIAKEVTASTVNQRCQTFQYLAEFMKLAGAMNLTPEVFKGFCRWLFEAKTPKGSMRFADATLSSLLTHIRALYKSGLESRYSGWSQEDLALISDVTINILRGCRERSAQRSVEMALSLETFSSLTKAVAGELEQCQRVLAEYQGGERECLYNLRGPNRNMLDPNPFVVLALIGATQHGLRAEELNALKIADLRTDNLGRHELYVHAKNKADDFIPVNETFIEAWRLCEEWARVGRASAWPDSKGLFEESLLIRLPLKNIVGRPLIYINSYNLNRLHLPYFFDKWFSIRTVDEEGDYRPVLHADGDRSRPLRVTYKKLRNAFAVRFAEREQSRAVTMRALRHTNPYTSVRFYLHQTRLDHAKKVQIALKSEASALAMRLKNPIEAGLSEETLQLAAAAGAITPHGLCGPALEHKGCERASDCLECPSLVLVVSRKPRLSADRDAYLELAEKLEKEGDLRAAENALARAKLCEAHLLRMESIYRGEDR